MRRARCLRAAAITIAVALSLAGAGCGGPSAGAARDREELERARALIAAGDLEAADHVLVERVRSKDSAAARDRLRGHVAVRRGDGDAAIALLAPLYEDGETDAWLLWDLARARILRGEASRGATLLTALLDGAPPPIQRDARLLAGEVGVQLGDDDYAKRAYGLALADDPGDEAAFVGLMRAQLLGGHVGEAMVEVQQRLRDHPHELDTRTLLGEIYVSANLMVQAYEAFAAVVRSDPARPAVWRDLGFVELRLGRYTAAVVSLERARQTFPDDPSLQNNLGLAHAGLGQIQKAEHWIRQALSHAPDSPALWQNLLRVHNDAGDPFAAMEASREVPAALLRGSGELDEAVFRTRLVATVARLICRGKTTQGTVLRAMDSVHDAWARDDLGPFDPALARRLLSRAEVRDDVQRGAARCADRRRRR